MKRYRLNGSIYLEKHDITVDRPEIERGFVGFNERDGSVQVFVHFFFEVQGVPTEKKCMYTPDLNPASLALTVSQASEKAMLNLFEEIGYELIEE